MVWLLVIVAVVAIAGSIAHASSPERESARPSKATGNFRPVDQLSHLKENSTRTPTTSRKARKMSPSTNWTSLMNRKDVLIVDTETTGLHKRAEVIEVVAVDTTGNVRFSSFSMPQDPIPIAASNIHGLTHPYLKKARAMPWPRVQVRLAPILEQAQILIAWNAPFDRRMLEQTAARHDLQFGFAPPWRDALRDYKRFCPGLNSYALENVMKAESLQFSGRAHRAEADCRAVLSVMQVVSRREQ